MKRPFFLTCILGSFAIGCYFSAVSIHEIFEFSLLDLEANARITRWEIDTDGNKYIIKTFFDFDATGKTFKGAYTFSSLSHANEWAAISSMKNLATSRWVVFYNSKNPSLNSLQCCFPVYNLIRAVISFVVCGYFFIVHRSVSTYFKN